MSSRRSPPGTGAGPKTTDPPEISISSDDEGAVVTREDGDRIFASSLAASSPPRRTRASAPRVARRARASRRWTTPSWKR